MDQCIIIHKTNKIGLFFLKVRITDSQIQIQSRVQFSLAAALIVMILMKISNTGDWNMYMTTLLSSSNLKRKKLSEILIA